jgi:hypothetical protein
MGFLLSVSAMAFGPWTAKMRPRFVAISELPDRGGEEIIWRGPIRYEDPNSRSMKRACCELWWADDKFTGEDLTREDSVLTVTDIGTLVPAPFQRSLTEINFELRAKNGEAVVQGRCMIHKDKYPSSIKLENILSKIFEWPAL